MKEPTNRLSATLRQLRKQADLSGIEAAGRAGLSQSKISRTETGTFMPTPDQVDTLCRVYQAPAKVRRELVQMAREVQAVRIPAKLVLDSGGWLLQERIGRIEQVAGRIRNLSLSVVPGLLQTRHYTTALFGRSLGAADLTRTVDARMARQHLLDTDRAFVFMIAEGALRWNMGGSAVMLEQLDRLVRESHRPNLRLGVVPWTTPVTVPLMHAFDIFDSRAVMFATLTATALATDTAEIAQYEQHWAEVEPFASYGDDARAAIEQIAADYRSTI